MSNKLSVATEDLSDNYMDVWEVVLGDPDIVDLSCLMYDTRRCPMKEK